MEAANEHDGLEKLNLERLCEINTLSDEVADLRKNDVLMEGLRNHLEDIEEQLPKLTAENSSLKEQVRNSLLYIHLTVICTLSARNIPDYTLCCS